MRIIFLLISLIVSLFFIRVSSVSAEALWNCTRFEMRVVQKGGPWTGGQWTATCPGDTGPSGCSGYSASNPKRFNGSDGELVIMDRCSCYGQPNSEACLNIPNIASSVPGCSANMIYGKSGPNGYCGTNGDYKYPVLEITCPTPTPPSPTPSKTPTPSPSKTPTPTATGVPPTPTATLPPSVPTPTTPPSIPTPTTPPGVPTPTRTPTPPSGPTNTPTPPRPTNTPPPAPTPTPDFNNAMCKCDQMNVGQISLGQPIQVEAFAKVEGQDTSKAVVKGMKFRIYEGNASAGRVRELPEKGDQPVTIVDNTPSLVRYRAEWTANPTLKVNEEYRIVATPDCQAKTAAIQADTQRVVLAARDENVGFFGQIINFFAGLFGRGSEPENEGVQIAEEESGGPLQAIGNFFRPQQNQRQDQLQLGTFTPAQMEKEACNIMKFKFSFTQ